jgi:acyl-CoA thioesterase I
MMRGNIGRTILVSALVGILAAVAIEIAVPSAATPKRPASTSAVNAPSTPAPAPAHLAVTTAPSVLFIGASYTAGWGASDPQLDYAHETATELGWDATYSAEPGAGYVTTGNNGHDSFAQQVAALPNTLRPSLVIIQGGRNDAGTPAAIEDAAVAKTLSAIRAKFGDPKIVMLGDVPNQLPLDSATLATNSDLAADAHTDGAIFVNAIAEKWMTPSILPGFQSNVPGHPNDAGHLYIAHRLVADLDQLGAL